MSIKISRAVETDAASVAASLCIGILSIPRSVNVDAMVVPPGEGENWRLLAAIRDWEEHVSQARFLLITGDNWVVAGKNGPDFTTESICMAPYNLARKDGVLVREYDDNTATQAVWAAENMRDLNLSSFSLHVSPYHLVRWYLTFIKTAEKMGKRFAVIPAPTPSSMDRIVPLSGLTPWDLVAGEIRRIKAYSEKENPDVATLPELQEYLTWLWEQPALRSYKERAE